MKRLKCSIKDCNVTYWTKITIPICRKHKTKKVKEVKDYSPKKYGK